MGNSCNACKSLFIDSKNEINASNSKNKEKSGDDASNVNGVKKLGNYVYDDTHEGNSKSKTLSEKVEELSNRSASKVDISRIREEIINKINEYRHMHQADSVTYNTDLNSLAQQHAQYLSNIDQVRYSTHKFNNEEIGEILFAINTLIPAEKLVNNWYQEEETHDYNDERGNPSSFTQLVWKSSKFLGFGCAKSKGGNYYYVANFYPVGNIEGEFMKNVLPKITSSKKPENFISHNYSDKKPQENQRYANNQEEPKDDLDEFSKEALAEHNALRKKHHVPELTINPELSMIAQRYAESMAEKDNFRHSGNTYKGKRLGENIYYCFDEIVSGKVVTNDWYSEIKSYDWDNPENPKGITGHFTQVVWKGTTEVGFGKATSNSGKHFVVGNYMPPGNKKGEYAANVIRP